MIRKHYSNVNEKDINCNQPESECNSASSDDYETSLIQLEFVKSALTVNPCMVNQDITFFTTFYLQFIFKSHQSYLYLQGEDKLYVNSADMLIKMFSHRSASKDDFVINESNCSYLGTNTLAEGRQWLVIPVPSTYSATNWPIRVYHKKLNIFHLLTLFIYSILQ